ncbi:hypothetical protein JTB14_009254 [Gonioctena quinquepunctata]|nr:hypothetical protein JTB14_009254 [Gonioctena quinquepunctata]
MDKLNYSDIEEDKFFALLQKTYPEMRQFLNTIECPPTIADVKSKWPVLFRKSVIVWHFKKLTGVDLITVQEKIKLGAEKIVAYGIAKNCLPAALPNKQFEQVLEFYAKYLREDLDLILD